MNVERLRAVQRDIITSESEFKMNRWEHCIAGRACRLRHAETGHESVFPESTAREWLGLTLTEAHYLFHGDWFVTANLGRPLADCTRADACHAIDRFIENSAEFLAGKPYWSRAQDYTAAETSTSETAPVYEDLVGV